MIEAQFGGDFTYCSRGVWAKEVVGTKSEVFQDNKSLFVDPEDRYLVGAIVV